MPSSRRLIDAPAWTAFAWVGVAALALSLGLLLLGRHWPELRMAACFFLPLLAVMLMRHGLPSLLLAVISACFLVSALGWALDWYSDFWWFDIVLHGLNPGIMVAGSLFMLWKAELVPTRRDGRFVILATLLGFALGVAWEGIEYLYLPFEWPDTILDVVMDTAGAALGGWFVLWLIRARGLPPKGRRTAGLLPADPVAVPIRR